MMCRRVRLEELSVAQMHLLRSVDVASAVSCDPRIPDTVFSMSRRLSLEPGRCREWLDELVLSGTLERLGPSDAPAYFRVGCGAE